MSKLDQHIAMQINLKNTTLSAKKNCSVITGTLILKMPYNVIYGYSHICNKIWKHG